MTFLMTNFCKSWSKLNGHFVIIFPNYNTLFKNGIQKFHKNQGPCGMAEIILNLELRALSSAH